MNQCPPKIFSIEILRDYLLSLGINRYQANHILANASNNPIIAANVAIATPSLLLQNTKT